MHRILSNLNEEQAQAAAATEGYIRVSAGAGTGKTSALTSRYAYIISALGISPRNALCVTFTNKAAGEMKGRICKLCGEHVEPMVATFHGFCCEFLRAEAEALGWSCKFSLWAVSDVRETLKTIYAELKVNGRDLTLKDCWEYIDSKKCADLSYVHLMLAPQTDSLFKLSQTTPSLKERIFYRYLYVQRTAAALDFDDLIAFTLYLLQNNEEVRLRWQKRLEYVMVDEFQDIDAQQYELVEILAGYHGNLFIVGDPDQTIYSFRGADVKFFTEFPQRHVDAKCFYFVKNYRSSREILDAAHTLISHNPDHGRKRLTAERRDIAMQDMVKIMIPHSSGNEDESEASSLLRIMGGHVKTDPVYDPKFQFVDEEIVSAKPAVVHTASPQAEASYIADEIAALYEKLPHADVAVLYRASHVATELERALIAKDIKYRILSGTAFLERHEIRLINSYMRLCLNPEDDIAFRYAVNEPRRGFGKRRLERLTADALENEHALFTELLQHLDDPLYVGKTSMRAFVQGVVDLNARITSLKPTRALDSVLNTFLLEEHWKDAGDEQSLEGTAVFRQLAYDFEENEGESTNVADFLSHVALSSQDLGDEHNVVRLMTVHASKGLEFDYVFLAGLNDGIFPSAKTSTPGEIQEERRLMYVAMTRAKKQLFITESRGFVRGGVENEPSRFLSDLKHDEIVEIGDRAARNRYAAAAEDVASFKENDRVFHEIFGPGTVRQVNSAHREYEIVFDLKERVRTMSFSAPLEEYKDQS